MCDCARAEEIVGESVRQHERGPGAIRFKDATGGLYESPPLRITRLRFQLEPQRPLLLPLAERGNVLRGSFGTVFQRAVCDPACAGAPRCARRESCAYAMLFEPNWRMASEGHGAGEAPRGFLFRPTQNPDPEFGPGLPLHFELRLFGQAIEVYPFFLNAFQALASQGLRGVPTRLQTVETLDWFGERRAELVKAGRVTREKPHELTLGELEIPPAPAGQFRIRFITPTWLRNEKQDESVPTIGGVLCRLRDRLSSLTKLYAERAWEANFGTIGDLARQANTLAARGAWTEEQRRSSKTGQEMPLAGFVGEVIYDQLAPELWPLLVWGQEFHVGRHAVWGNGGYHLL